MKSKYNLKRLPSIINIILNHNKPNRYHFEDADDFLECWFNLCLTCFNKYKIRDHFVHRQEEDYMIPLIDREPFERSWLKSHGSKLDCCCVCEKLTEGQQYLVIELMELNPSNLNALN